eukprot:5310315-Prymnesium_polylepis.1
MTQCGCTRFLDGVLSTTVSLCRKYVGSEVECRAPNGGGCPSDMLACYAGTIVPTTVSSSGTAAST